MALVAFLRGINVGGHRRLSTSELAHALRHLDVVNIGAAGTFVVRGAVTRNALRAAIAEQLPYDDVDIMLCDGRELLRLVDEDPFAGQAASKDIVPFVSVLAPGAKPTRAFPLSLPPDGDWCLKVLRRDGPFVIGMYRRQMKALASLAQLEKICAASITTRNWNTIAKVADVLRAPRRSPPTPPSTRAGAPRADTRRPATRRDARSSVRSSAFPAPSTRSARDAPSRATGSASASARRGRA
jgi:uncharacterized protein (DUF1697 family)